MASEDKASGSNEWMRIAEAFAAKESTRAEDVVALVAGIRQVMSAEQAGEQAPKQITSQPQNTLPAPVAAAVHEATAAPAPAPEQAPAADPATTARAEQIHAETTETTPAPKTSTRGRKPAAATPATKPAKPAKAPAAPKPKAEKSTPAPSATPTSGEDVQTDFSHITKAKDEGKEPAVPLDQAFTDEEVRCLECGRSMKMLKRHLGSTHGMTPEEYKFRWDLPDDFPITAPNYSASKSEYAKDMGFGLTGSKAAPKKRGRRKKEDAE